MTDVSCIVEDRSWDAYAHRFVTHSEMTLAEIVLYVEDLARFTRVEDVWHNLRNEVSISFVSGLRLVRRLNIAANDTDLDQVFYTLLGKFTDD